MPSSLPLPEKMLAEALRQELLADHSLETCVQILHQYKSAGGEQRNAYDILESLRGTAADEESEDRILDLMDFVSGFCSPHMDIIL